MPANPAPEVREGARKAIEQSLADAEWYGIADRQGWKEQIVELITPSIALFAEAHAEARVKELLGPLYTTRSGVTVLKVDEARAVAREFAKAIAEGSTRELEAQMAGLREALNAVKSREVIKGVAFYSLDAEIHMRARIENMVNDLFAALAPTKETPGPEKRTG